MIEKLTNSWELVKASGRVLMADKELLLFPVFSGIALIIVTASFLLPLAVAGIARESGGAIGFAGYAVLFLFYFVWYSVMLFFNSALVGAALIRLEGGDPTVGDGLRIAMQHLGSILQYAVIAATVGMILRVLKERSGLLGRLLLALGGFAWSLATFLVVPILVTQGVGPIEAIQQSASLLRKTWGEQLAGTIGIGFFFGVISVVYTIVAIPLFVMAAIAKVPLAVLLLMVALIVGGYLLLALISSALSGIYAAALYRFAATGQSGLFDRQLLAHAFQPKY
jgi:hypothetical protein